MQHSTPAAPAVRETLERLLVSETFGRSERARKLLRYLVEREQAGEADRLKGFAIAVDVFGKDADFDSSTDAVVRVQVGRLRDLLQQYFATEGALDPVRIIIPRGSYVPTYEPNSVPPERRVETAEREPAAVAEISTTAAAPAVAVAVPGSTMVRQIQLFWMAIGIVIAMLGVLIFRQGSSIATFSGSQAADSMVEAAGATSSILQPQSAEALPVVYISVKGGSTAAGRVAASLRAGLSSFDTIDFIGRSPPQPSDPAGDATSFVFDILPGQATGEVTLELQNLASGRVLLSRSLSTEDTAPSNVEDRIAGVLSASIPASGPIYGYIEQNGLQTGLTKCLLLDDQYYLDQNATSHKAAYRCLENLLGQNARSPLIYSELASLHLEAVTDHYAYPPGATAEQAKAYAHRAVQMGATSPSAHRAYGYVNSRIGNTDEAIRWMRKAYELNTYDLGMAAAYGYGLIFAGRYAEGTPIIARAVEASSAHPTWWDFGLFLGEFMLGNEQAAARASSVLFTTDAKSHYLAARLIGAKARGDEEQAGRLLDELTTEFPKFAADPRRTFLERKYPADLTNRLVEALRAAGLGNAG